MRPRTRSRRSGRRARVLTAEGHDPGLEWLPGGGRETVGVQAGADDRAVGVDHLTVLELDRGVVCGAEHPAHR